MDRELAVGRIYRHYTGELYMVLGVENGLVIYQNMTTKVEWSEPIENFLGLRKPDWANSNQEYQFERADIIHKLNRPEVDKFIKEHDGYCPYAVKEDADNKCMCKAFREAKEDCLCFAGLYRKFWCDSPDR